MLSIRRSCVFILSLSLLLFFSLCTISKAQESEPAKSTVSSTLAEGSWAVDGSAKLTFTYKENHKVKHRSVVLDTTEVWTFVPGGAFTALDHDTGFLVTGSWSEKGKNVTVFFNKAEYQTLIQEALAFKGFPGVITITKLTATGKVGTSTIRGKLTLKAHGNFGFVSGTITATANFAGAKTSADAIVNADPESKSLKEAISELVGESLSSPDE